MHRSRLAALVIDSKVDDLDSAAKFWGDALGYDPALFSENGASKYLHLQTPTGAVSILLQKVEHASRVHLDIETDDIQAEVNRLKSLGATVVNAMEKWTIMQAPTGHRFCVVAPQRPDFHQSQSTNTWP